MNFVVSIDKNFTNYDFIEDVLDFHINGRRKSVLCYVDFHPFLETYATEHHILLKRVELKEITKGYYVVIIGENNSLLKKCKELKLKQCLIREEI